MDGIYHVIRGFEDEEIIHDEGRLDPIEDLEIIHGELRVKDLERTGNMMQVNDIFVEKFILQDCLISDLSFIL